MKLLCLANSYKEKGRCIAEIFICPSENFLNFLLVHTFLLTLVQTQLTMHKHLMCKQKKQSNEK